VHLHQHLDLLCRTDRTRALRRLIARVVQPGSRVLDAGCGTGVLSVWAARAGAAEVVGVDIGDVTLAEQTMRDNGCGEVFSARRATIEEYCDSPGHGRFDVVLALLYVNDPRRDEAQSELVLRLRETCLAPGGVMLPDRVHYSAALWEWPGQDVTARQAQIAARVAGAERELGLDLRTLRERLAEAPDLRFFPRRRPSGLLEMDAARQLGDPVDAFGVDYRSGPAAYPSAVELAVARPGVATCVVWTQRLLCGDEVAYSNDSVSWIRNPRRVDAGWLCRVALDAGWRGSNQLRLEASPDPSQPG